MYNFKLDDLNFLPHCGAEVEFSLEKGEMLILTGENGVGKSTLMGCFYNNFPDQCALVDQTPLDYFYDRSLYKIKNIFLTSHKERVDEIFFHELWSLFGLDKKEDRLQSSLSGGEGQLLKIVLGLSIHVDIYLLDEPSHYLDQSMKEKLSKVISSLLSKNKSLFLIEHDLSWIKESYHGLKINLQGDKLREEKRWNT